MSEWPFVDSPRFPVVAAALFLLLSAIAWGVSAPAFLIWTLLVVAFPFAFEAGAWGDAVRQGSLVYDVEMSRVDEAYSAQGTLPRYLLGWLYGASICVLREWTSLNQSPLIIPLIIVPVVVWVSWCWISNYRAVRMWAQENGLRSRWANGEATRHIGWGIPASREGRLVVAFIVTALAALICLLAYGFTQVP